MTRLLPKTAPCLHPWDRATDSQVPQQNKWLRPTSDPPNPLTRSNPFVGTMFFLNVFFFNCPKQQTLKP